MEPSIIEQRPVSMGELRTEIERIKKRDKEPSIRVTKVEDYLNSFSHLTQAREKELAGELQKLEVPRLRDEHIAKIVDLLPKAPDDLKMILQGYVISVSNENLKRIADTVSEFVAKK